ncbi:MAG: prephenate dehydratase [Candidatus Nanosalina sp. J07AB43]|nr:MAG: prephenate dehydratase [Candidatus Nanosalina sp. J07AB43]
MIDQRIAIIGGTGKFGRHLGKRLDEENEVTISSSSIKDAERVADDHGWDYGENKQVVKDADVVIVAVPVSVTEDVIHEIGPYVPNDALFTDITSVKQGPVEAMSEYSDQVLGMHPMYAPSNTIQGQNVALCPESGKKWTVMEEFWKNHGAEVTVTDPEEHDRAMSLIQGLMHFSELVLADVIRKSELGDEDAQQYSTPIYSILTDLTARMLNQSPGLYRSIQAENPENDEIRQRFIESAKEISDLVDDPEEFSERFEEMGKEFELKESQKRSDKLIEHLSSL